MTGLWTVVQPCARPIKLETLNRKRLAVDASIWIYQFLKAVRDKEGNALRNSHVVGFFRRICKLLFFGIKPVFVFDGGAPILKRQTVSSRKARREGRREDAVRTAGKLLAVQMQRRAEEEDQRRKDENERSRQDDEEEEVPDNPVYVDELQMTAQERAQNRTFRKKDAYHLPNLDVNISDLGAPNDPRIMSHEELEEYARQFHRGEDVAMYDFSKIDFDSAFFTSLPASDRYNILNAARLRSRLRMGYSKEQLDTMFPNRMDFSRFQIDRVKERNELTQRLMNLNGMNGEDAQFDQGARIAGEKGKEYVLVKNDGVEGGWALGVVSNKGEGERSKPIDVEDLDRREQGLENGDEEQEEDGFEDVPIEGLNRLPSRYKRQHRETENLPFDSEDAALRRRKIYEARLEKAGRPKEAGAEAQQIEETDELFVPQEGPTGDQTSDADELFEDVPTPEIVEEDDDLQRAIAMSLENADQEGESETEMASFAASRAAGPRIDQPLQFNPKNAKIGRDFAHLTNNRAHGKAPKPFDEDSDEDDFNLRAGMGESRNSNRKIGSGPRVHGFKRPDQSSAPQQTTPGKVSDPAPESRVPHSEFSGPLPFESISLGKSVLGGKKKKPAAEAQGGFEKEGSREGTPQPLPPWFSGDIRDDVAKQNAIEEHQYEGGDPARKRVPEYDPSILKRHETGDIIDLDAPKTISDEVISVQSSDDEELDDVVMGESKPIDNEVRMTDVADLARAEPPVSEVPNNAFPEVPEAAVDSFNRQNIADKEQTSQPITSPSKQIDDKTDELEDTDEELPIDWSESEAEESAAQPVRSTPSPKLLHNEQGTTNKPVTQSITPSPTLDRAEPTLSIHVSQDLSDESNRKPDSPPLLLKEELSINAATLEGLEADEEHTFSDPEDEDLMRQLAGEAEEHARFASTLNAKSYLQNAEEYERELRQLRNQQKKDRRDADEVSHIMVTECQALLRLFGLPYITAPMEAEAQCATLVSLGLVDGIVTDDSDIFLFGGTRVYKNMFNQSKFVECYLSSDFEKEYGLTREKLIRFAHLLGSDYTEGLPTVGPVTALEILSEFETLEQFSEWWSAVQMAPKPRPEDVATPFRKKFRKNATKIFLPTTFPDTRVDYAYLNPEVDADPQAFQWGVPDLDALRSFLMATIGWSQERTDEVLVPVIKDMNRRETEGTQANITQFFGGGVGVGARQNVYGGNANASAGAGAGDGQTFAPRRRNDGKSKRMENALGRLQERAHGRENGGDQVDGRNGGQVGGQERAKKQKKGRGRKRVVPDDDDDANEEDVQNHEEMDVDDAGDEAPQQPKKKGRRKGKANT